jgi:hypothetical protein
LDARAPTARTNNRERFIVFSPENNCPQFYCDLSSRYRLASGFVSLKRQICMMR